MIKTRKGLIKAYIEFFKKKEHKEIPNASLIPENDPTVLFTTAGMHPLVPYLLGQRHPLGKRLVNVQKCIRTSDIEEVGDEIHHTFIEMLGNWSLGDYWKKEAVEMSFEFLTRILKMEKEKIGVTCFKGDKDAPRDEEAAEAWLGVGIRKQRIAFLGKKDNWWGPAGKTGPCGPDTEMFYYIGKKPGKFKPEDKKWIEFWNDVLMEYNKTENGFLPLKQKNVDTGMGVERVIAVLNGYDDNYKTELWKPLIKIIEKLSKKKYEKEKKNMRIVADHVKASVFILSELIKPSNTEQGYVLRRLIRRAVRYGKLLGIEENFTTKLAEPLFRIYNDYEHLKKNKNFILTELDEEENRFRAGLEKGLRVFEKIARKKISGKDAFLLYQSYGFPIEMTKELAKEKGIKINIEDYEKEYREHQKKSRTATQGKFKSGLADKSVETTKLHTATHLLLAALKKVLGKEIRQRGSNITAERLRLDFNFNRKLTDEELEKIEKLVNEQIKKKLELRREEMSVEKARKKGAEATFESKYGERVSVYSIGDFSCEICAGPHVKNIGELGEFKIKKEESSSAGVRRIKAILK